MDQNLIYQPWHVSVLIPARDEERLLPRCLKSVLEAAAMLDGLATCDVVVVADRSTDNTARIAADLINKNGAVLIATAGAAGAARALAANYALGRRKRPLERWWLANTDADCVVPSFWLVDQLMLAWRGIEALLGTINVDTFEEHGPDVPERFRASYTIAPSGWHPHIHGANLGVRADVYRNAGGWAPLETAEDHDLWGRLVRGHARIFSTACIEVITSGRRMGRAPHGFADALAAHNEVAA